jgi:hypothetical protein
LALVKKKPALLVVSLVLVALAGALPAETLRNHFDTDSIMRAPGFFDFAVLGAPGAARWLILSDRNPPSAPNCLSQTEAARPADSIAAALRRNQVFQDGTVSTFVQRGANRAGLLLRMADEKNFLVLLSDTGTGETVLWSYRDGQPSELGRGRAAFERGWEELGVTASGPKLSVLFNGQKLFEAVDPRPAAGRTGLATAGPGAARFDEFSIAPADAPGPAANG